MDPGFNLVLAKPFQAGAARAFLLWLMEDEFVVGFIEGEPDGLTPIDIVAEIVGITEDELRNSKSFEVVKFIEVKPQEIISTNNA